MTPTKDEGFPLFLTCCVCQKEMEGKKIEPGMARKMHNTPCSDCAFIGKNLIDSLTPFGPRRARNIVIQFHGMLNQVRSREEALNLLTEIERMLAPREKRSAQTGS